MSIISDIRRRLVVAFAGCALLLGCGITEAPGGAASPRAAVDAYVTGLNQHDAQRLALLAPIGNDPAADIQRRLETHGGRQIRLENVDISSEISPKMATARLVGRGISGQYQETLVLTRQDQRWYVALGAHPHPAKTPASTARPSG
ncbi:hypothetical protein [Nonomuraea sp. C10]|uniref:hypothetical protein n=1 Tax=Nonomuraea sp. C10 TaxID=2600577 RepID=UPI0011CE466C|nr:hypothetical protein [Nonomuraea sp. C10]TXK35275.1 hypothetical protein FR742_39215 [Nonomuraea sp. C10]